MTTSPRKINDPTLVVMKKVSNIVVGWIVKTPITANQITISNFFVFIPLSSYFFFRGDYISNLIALGLLVANSFFDLIDGEVARRKEQTSKLGHWLDTSLDFVLQTMIMYAIAAHIFVNVDDFWKYFALLPLFGQGLANGLGLRLTYEYHIDPFSGNTRLDELFEQKRSFLDHFMKNMLIPSHVVFLALFTLRTYIFIGVVTNTLPLLFVAFGVPILIRSISMYIITSLQHAKPELSKKYATFQYLSEKR